MCDPGEAVHGTGAPDQADHIVALLKKQLGEVGPVLPGDARDQGSSFLHLQSPSWVWYARASLPVI